MNKKLPKCQLLGEDGNVFAIIGKVKKTLNQAGLKEQGKEFVMRAMGAESYDEILQLSFEYVDVM
jgi:hypothetical protein